MVADSSSVDVDIFSVFDPAADAAAAAVTDNRCNSSVLLDNKTEKSESEVVTILDSEKYEDNEGPTVLESEKSKEIEDAAILESEKSEKS